VSDSSFDPAAAAGKPSGRAPVTRRRLLADAAISAAFVAAAPAISYAQTRPIKIGVILPTSGILAATGQKVRRGVDFAAKIVRERDGLPIELSHADTESKAETGRVAAERLVRDGCCLLIGTSDSGSAMSVAQAAEGLKVPFVINSAAAPQITEQGFTQVFRNFPKSTTLVDDAILRMKEMVASLDVKPKTAVMMHMNDTFGQSMIEALDAKWDQAGAPVKILEKISYDVRTSDLSIEVSRARAVGADLLMPITRVNDAILLVRELVKQNWSPMGIFSPGSPGPYDRSFVEALGKYADGYLSSAVWYNQKNPRARALAERFEKETKEWFELNVVAAFQAVEIAADAIKRAGSSEPAALHAALKTTNITDTVVTGGAITFDETGQNNNVHCVLLQNREGKLVTVGPEDQAVGKLSWPLVPYDKR
jgi:branched-chain amino acid transport system substrate-binding protein